MECPLDTATCLDVVKRRRLPEAITVEFLDNSIMFDGEILLMWRLTVITDKGSI